MCLSTVYTVEPGGEERTKVCEYVSGVSATGDSVVLTDIMGIETVLRGSIRSLDLINNEILIDLGKE